MMEVLRIVHLHSIGVGYQSSDCSKRWAIGACIVIVAIANTVSDFLAGIVICGNNSEKMRIIRRVIDVESHFKNLVEVTEYLDNCI